MFSAPRPHTQRWTDSQTFFVIFKLPALLAAAILGFIIEFLYELPFMLVCVLEEHFQRKAKSR